MAFFRSTVFKYIFMACRTEMIEKSTDLLKPTGFCWWPHVIWFLLIKQRVKRVKRMRDVTRREAAGCWGGSLEPSWSQRNYFAPPPFSWSLNIHDGQLQVQQHHTRGLPSYAVSLLSIYIPWSVPPNTQKRRKIQLTPNPGRKRSTL